MADHVFNEEDKQLDVRGRANIIVEPIDEERKQYLSKVATSMKETLEECNQKLDLLQEKGGKDVQQRMTADYMERINEKKCMCVDGYPDFAFYFDTETQKYAIVNRKTKVFTAAFVDDIIYNKVPLKTWTAKYVVAKIGKQYYLCDADGNCYHEAQSPYTICRNGFVNKEEKFFVTKDLMVKRFENYSDSSGVLEEGLTVVTIGEMNFAMHKINVFGKNSYALIQSDGELLELEEGGTLQRIEYFERLPDWIVGRDVIRKNFCGYLLKHIDLRSLRKEYLSEADIYSYRDAFKRERFFSMRFEKEIDRYVHDGWTEIFWMDGRVYTMVKAELREIPNMEDVRFTGDKIVCRQGSNVVLYNKNWDKIAEETLSPKELHLQLLLEAMVKKYEEK